MIADVICRLRALFRRNSVESELDEELLFHVEHEVEKLRAAGLTEEEARRRVRAVFGGMDQVKEECRDARGVRLAETVFQDLRYAVRVFRAAPAFTAVAVLSLAIGIGANTAIFSLVNDLLLRTLPVRDPQQLLLVQTAVRPVQGVLKGLPAARRVRVDYSKDALHVFRARSHDLAEVFGYFVPGRVGVEAGGQARLAYPMAVSGNFFNGLGVNMALGRPLADADDRPGSTAAVVTYNFWQRAFRADPAVIGRTIKVDGVPFTVIGVSAPGFYGLAAGGFFGPTDIFTPLEAYEFRSGKPAAAPDNWWIRMMARPKPGVMPERLTERLTSAHRDVIVTSGMARTLDFEDGHVVVAPGDKGLDDLRRTVKEPLLVLLGVVAVVLLLACVNVANLLVARAAARQKELAVRISMGAGRGRIIRQLLTEAVLLAAAGAVLGLAFSVSAARLIAAMLTETWARVELNLAPDYRVFAFAAVISLAASVLFGLRPAWQATDFQVAAKLKQSSTGARVSGRLAVRKWLLAGQVALSVLLLVGAGLLVRSLNNLYKVDAGFATERLLLFRLEAGALRYPDEGVAAVHDRVLESLRGMPGVSSAAAMSNMLLAGWHNTAWMSCPGSDAPRAVSVFMHVVSPGIFETLGMPIVAGRGLSLHDTASAPPVAVLNQAAERQLCGGQLGVGRVLMRRAARGLMSPVEVVGVARDAKYDSLRKQVVPTVFMTYAQASNVDIDRRVYVVRTKGDPLARVAAVKRAIAGIDRRLVPADLKTQTRQIDESLHRERLFTTLVGSFGVFALLLAAIGLHGLAAYATTRRTGEIGLRMALGASRRQVMFLVVRQVMGPVAAGMAAGLVASWFAVRWIQSMLFGVGRVDGFTIVGVLVMLGAVAVAAAFEPAWRAAHMDAMKALRAE